MQHGGITEDMQHGSSSLHLYDLTHSFSAWDQDVPGCYVHTSHKM